MPGVCLLAAFFLQCLYCAWQTSQTTDETFFTASGYPMVRYNNYQILGEHPPLMMQLGALPLLFLQPKYPLAEPIYISGSREFDISKMGAKFLYDMGNDPKLILLLERIPIILVACLLGLVLYVWTYELYGSSGAILSLSLFAFCPNIIANSSLYTTDLGVAAFMFLALYRLKKLLDVPSIKNAAWVGVSSGLAFLSKISALTLPVMVAVIFFIYYFTGGKKRILDFATAPESKVRRFDLFFPFIAIGMFLFSLSEKTVAVFLGPICILGLNIQTIQSQKWKPLLSRAQPIVSAAAWIICVNFVIMIAQKREPILPLAAAIWMTLVFAFTYWLRRRVNDRVLIDTVKIFCFIWFVSGIMIILGYTDFFSSFRELSPFHHYVRTFHTALSHAMTDHKICVPGSFVTCDWKYFLATMAIKTPVVTLIFFLLGAICLSINKLNPFDKIIIVISPLIFLSIASFLNHINIGLRHVLPVYPFIFLTAGSSIQILSKISSGIIKRTLSIAAGAMILWLAFVSVRTLPHQLSYFNEFVGPVERGAALVGGSNLNWGQDTVALIQFMKRLNVSSVKVANTAHNPDEYRHYGLTWEPMNSEDFVQPASGYYVLDVLHYVHEQKNKNSWFRGRPPDYVIGKTLYIFKISKG